LPGSVKEDNIVGRMANIVSMFAALKGNKHVAMEKQGMATVRYSIIGQREVGLVSFEDLSNYAVAAGFSRNGNQSLWDFYAEALDTMTTKETLDLFFAQGGVIWHHVCNPGEALYTPACSFVIERVVGAADFYGLRTMSLNKSDAAKHNFGAMMTQYEATGKTPEEDQLLKFWKAWEGLFDDKKPAAGKLVGGAAASSDNKGK